MGALLFAVPAALALPFLLVVRSLAPGPLFAGLGRSSRDLWIGGLFSLAGIAILSILWLWRGERWLASRGRPAGRRKPESRE